VVDLYRFKPGAAKPLLERAAQLYEQGLDFGNAARAYEGIGDHLRAAVCLERAGKVATAAASGDATVWVDLNRG
jgi:hypothetical protein